jgi:hypothetical protein
MLSRVSSDGTLIPGLKNSSIADKQEHASAIAHD